MEATAGVDRADRFGAVTVLCIRMSSRSRQKRVAACHDAGLAVNTWTCNDPVRLVELADWGVDGCVH